MYVGMKCYTISVYDFLGEFTKQHLFHIHICVFEGYNYDIINNAMVLTYSF